MADVDRDYQESVELITALTGAQLSKRGLTPWNDAALIKIFPVGRSRYGLRGRPGILSLAPHEPPYCRVKHGERVNHLA
jgi:hypothetical protein